MGEGHVLTPRNDEPDCRIRATDNTKRREILHVLIVRDGEQHPVDIKWAPVQYRIGINWPQRFFQK